MLVSIITPCYNSKNTLNSTIESVKSQDYKNIEHIVIDGGSTDGTLDILKSNSSISNWVSESDNGIYDAINKGIKMAKGEIIGILNSDDFYHRSDSVSILIRALQSDKSISFVFADLLFVSNKNSSVVKRYYSSRLFHPRFLRFGLMPAHPTFFTYKKNYKEFGLYDTSFKISGDFELICRFINKFNLEYKYIQLDLVSMRLGGVSNKSISNRILLNKELVRACKKNNIYSNSLFVYLKYFIKIYDLFYFKDKLNNKLKI